MWGQLISNLRHNKLAYAAFAALFALGISTYLIPNSVRSAATDQIEDVSEALDMLAGRSPGERTKAELAKAKARKAVLAGEGSADDGKPKKQLAANDASEPKNRIRNIPAPEKSPSDLLNIPGPLAQNDGIRVPDLGVPVDGSPGGGLGAIGPGIFPGFPGGGGGGGGFVPQEPDPDNPDVPAPTEPPTSPVPEPGVWALMIFGMGLCGSMLRRRNRSAGKPSDMSCGSQTS